MELDTILESNKNIKLNTYGLLLNTTFYCLIYVIESNMGKNAYKFKEHYCNQSSF